MMGRLIYAGDVISLLANHHFDDRKENTKILNGRGCFCGCQSVKMHQCIPSSIVAGKTKVIGLECVLEDFARIVVIRRTTYVKA